MLAPGPMAETKGAARTEETRAASRSYARELRPRGLATSLSGVQAADDVQEPLLRLLSLDLLGEILSHLSAAELARCASSCTHFMAALEPAAQIKAVRVDWPLPPRASPHEPVTWRLRFVEIMSGQSQRTIACGEASSLVRVGDLPLSCGGSYYAFEDAAVAPHSHQMLAAHLGQGLDFVPVTMAPAEEGYDASAPFRYFEPVLFPRGAPSSGLAMVSMGCYHSCALDRNGHVWTWGADDYGRLGHRRASGARRAGRQALRQLLSHHYHMNRPSRIAALPARVVQVSCGLGHTLLLLQTGVVLAFGEGDSGRLGLGNEDSISRPTPVASLAHTRVVCVSANQSLYSIVATSDGALYGWGLLPLRGSGVLEPVRMLGHVYPPAAFASCSAGHKHGLAVTIDGRLYSFGLDQDGCTGVGNLASSDLLPWHSGRLVHMPVFARICLAVAGRRTSFAVSTAGELFSCGDNRCGQLGHAKEVVTSPRPTRVLGALASEDVVEVAAGREHTLVSTASGRLYSFGYGAYGQLGLPASGDALEPRVLGADSTSGHLVQWGPRRVELMTVDRHLVQVLEWLPGGRATVKPVGAAAAWQPLGGNGVYEISATRLEELPSARH